jgi:hypothetical protein
MSKTRSPTAAILTASVPQLQLTAETVSPVRSLRYEYPGQTAIFGRGARGTIALAS